VTVPGFPAPLEAGRVLGGRYRLVNPIARGGMSEVWEGYDEVLSRPVAVKLLQAHLAEDGIFLERFRREAVTAARLAHPGMVSTFDTGVDHGSAFIVMELVRGRTLRQLLIDQGRLEPWLAVAIARQIADAMIYAHQAGLVHRDIKPANVLLTDDEWGGLRVKVTDFGIAKAGAALGGDLTRTGTVLGTPKYLSPEQIRGDEPDARADLYALGVVLFEMLVGSPPFVGPTDMSTAMAHLNNPAPRVSSRVRAVPPALDRLVSDCLAKDPRQRVPTALALRQRLDACNLSPPLAGAPNGRRSSRRHRDVTVPLVPRLPQAPGGTVPPEPAAPRPGPALTAVLGSSGAAPSPSPVRTTSSQRVTRLGPDTDAMDVLAARPPPPRRAPARKGHRRRWGPGLIVLGLVVAGAVVAGVLLNTRHHGEPATQPQGSGQPVRGTHQITSVALFMVRGTPDDPQDLPLTFDGNPATYWHTDLYRNATFSNLYPGLGLAIHLSAAATLLRLTVTSPTTGWAAQTYTSAAPVASGQPVSAWGAPTDSRTAINGSASFTLGGRRGQWVLLWLTNLGPSFQTRINELSVS
jgi:eukaryotic-like serine/threonine-protein kinase